jgi:hypothetical protein
VEQGSILVEAAITLPFLLVLAISLYDIGSIIRNHHALTQTAREIVRIAGGKEGLESGTSQLVYSSAVSALSCGNGFQCVSGCDANPTHMEVICLAPDILRSSNTPNLNEQSLFFSLTYSAAQDQVEVIIRGNYVANLNVFRNHEIRVRAVGPYL